MKKAQYILIFISIQLFGQTDSTIEFYPLASNDTVYNINELNKYERIDSLNSENYFFSYKNKDFKSGLFLIKQNRTNWIVYDFEIGSNLGPNTSIISFHKENERFISIQTSRSPSGMCSNLYGFLILLDIENNKTISYCNHNFQECYDKNSEVLSQSECKVTLEIENEFITIKSTRNPDDGLQCAESAEYRIEGNELIKTKYYSYLTQQLYPILCIGNICTGTTIRNLKMNFPGLTFRGEPLFMYGYDSEEQGIEFCEDGVVKFFVTIPDSIVSGISIISSEYNFNGINTDSTISQILRKYRNLRLHIDLISDWEYVYLKDEMVRFVFQTNKTNRIGIYEKDFEKGTRKIKRNDVKVDFIQI